MRIVVAAVGRLKPGPDRELAERYRDRAIKAGRALGLRGPDVIEVKESRAREAKRRVTEEAVALNGAIPDDAIKVVLDSRGQNASSDTFALRIRAWRDGGRQAVCFIIGGADGVAAGLLEGADRSFAFGSATWPHQLVRIMLMEQLYRAMTILSGHPYHRD
ncbi:MAG TPA: 23S rRNA (pseudouridine(1915)-N(3))-methyltransferase RlmH [Xanthobacteraceae bacterium]|nr:23S rRNA (pseudouridine(1915)-N(3))-methyltransferase RlmH [Xanthobacteraceae bacterium]